MILSQVTLVCLAALVLGGNKFISASSFTNCGDTCPETCLCPCNQTTGDCKEGCVAGYYGNNCNKKCDPRCRINGCLQHSGQCVCLLGYLYTNSRCQKDTGKQCQTHLGCLNDRCSSTGEEECIEGCKRGRFGLYCESPCEDNCFCDQESGKCTDCVPGWFGPECQSQCSSGCTEGCYKNGSCIDGCKPGSYGEQCMSICPRRCKDNLCDLNGSCIRGCVKGYYGETCDSTCQRQCDDGLCDLNGRCTSCQTRFYGPECSKICEGCAEGHCDRDTGECNNEDNKETLDINFSWVAGGVTLLITGAVLIVYVSYRLKRMDGRINYSAKWRRHPSAVGDDLSVVSGPHVVPDPSDVNDELGNISPRVCPVRRHEPATYIEPFHSVGNPVLPQQQAVSDSDQQTAAASPENLQPSDGLLNLQPSDGLLNQAATLSCIGDASSRPDSYVVPNYCEINEDLIFMPNQLQRNQQTVGLIKSSSPLLSDRVSEPSNDRHATGDINIPLIAECTWNTETEDSLPDKDSRPDEENYDHPFKDHYC